MRLADAATSQQAATRLSAANTMNTMTTLQSPIQGMAYREWQPLIVYTIPGSHLLPLGDCSHVVGQEPRTT